MNFAALSRKAVKAGNLLKRYSPYILKVAATGATIGGTILTAKEWKEVNSPEFEEKLKDAKNPRMEVIKHMAPGVGLVAAGVTGDWVTFLVMVKREGEALAALAAQSAEFLAYRECVKNVVGDDVEEAIYTGYFKDEPEEDAEFREGKEIKDEYGLGAHTKVFSAPDSKYAKSYDSLSTLITKAMSTRQACEGKVVYKGYIFENEIWEAFGFHGKELSPDGWKYGYTFDQDAFNKDEPQVFLDIFVDRPDEEIPGMDEGCVILTLDGLRYIHDEVYRGKCQR